MIWISAYSARNARGSWGLKSGAKFRIDFGSRGTESHTGARISLPQL